MPEPLPNVAAAASFEEASILVLDYLRRTLPLSFWAVTRVENDRQTYLHLEDNGYGLQRGGSHAWESSYCIHMVAGRTPTIALDAQAVPEYAAAAVNEAVTIGTYAGAPVREPDGTIFGAICGLDPERRTDDAALAAAGPVLQLLGQLLSMALSTERQRAQHSAALLAERVKGETDLLTGLLNRRAWERTMQEEAKLFASFADPTVIALLDLDMLKAVNDRLGHQAGDDYIRRAGQALLAAVREGDEVARLGGGRVRHPAARLHRGHRSGDRRAHLQLLGAGARGRLRRLGADLSPAWAAGGDGGGRPGHVRGQGRTARTTTAGNGQHRLKQRRGNQQPRPVRRQAASAQGPKARSATRRRRRAGCSRNPWR